MEERGTRYQLSGLLILQRGSRELNGSSGFSGRLLRPEDELGRSKLSRVILSPRPGGAASNFSCEGSREAARLGGRETGSEDTALADSSLVYEHFIITSINIIMRQN